MLEKTVTFLISLSEEEISKLKTANLYGVGKLKPSISEDQSISWRGKDNERVELLPKTQNGNFIKIILSNGQETQIHKKFLVCTT